jgi:predicted alpha/beta superfamily hydrolase
MLYSDVILAEIFSKPEQVEVLKTFAIHNEAHPRSQFLQAGAGSRGLNRAAGQAQFEPVEDEIPYDGAPEGRIFLYGFHSGILPDDRRVIVYLPPQYFAEPERRFGVMYLHDGQNLFDPRTSYVPGRTWQAGATADQLAAEGAMEPVILVGIANTGLRRLAEYTPTRDFRMGGGDGDRYGRMIVEELKPFVDENFRTQPEAAHTGLGGSSLGGLISLYLGLQYPEVFSRLAVLSPSIWWDHRSILNYVMQFQREERALPRIWLDIGLAEGARHVRDVEVLGRLLSKRGWVADRDLRVVEVAGAVHDEQAWAARFGDVLTFLFPCCPR